MVCRTISHQPGKLNGGRRSQTLREHAQRRHRLSEGNAEAHLKLIRREPLPELTA